MMTRFNCSLDAISCGNSPLESADSHLHFHQASSGLFLSFWIDMLSCNVVAIFILNGSGEVALAVARTRMLFFTRDLVSTYISLSHRWSISVTYARTAVAALAGRLSFSMAFTKSSCTLSAKNVRSHDSVLVAYLRLMLFPAWTMLLIYLVS